MSRAIIAAIADKDSREVFSGGLRHTSLTLLNYRASDVEDAKCEGCAAIIEKFCAMRHIIQTRKGGESRGISDNEIVRMFLHITQISAPRARNVTAWGNAPGTVIISEPRSEGAK